MHTHGGRRHRCNCGCLNQSKTTREKARERKKEEKTERAKGGKRHRSRKKAREREHRRSAHVISCFVAKKREKEDRFIPSDIFVDWSRLSLDKYWGYVCSCWSICVLLSYVLSLPSFAVQKVAISAPTTEINALFQRHTIDEIDRLSSSIFSNDSVERTNRLIEVVVLAQCNCNGADLSTHCLRMQNPPE